MKNSIPKIIHQIWMQGINDVSDQNMSRINNIVNLHKKWKYVLWDENMIYELLKNNPDWLDEYDKFVYLHQKVDFAKFVILYNFGGIYIDIDCDIIKNLDDIFAKIDDYDIILSKMSDKIDSISNYIMCGKNSDCLNNGIIIGKPHTYILSYLIENFKTQCNFYENKIMCIQNTTGPPIFNELIDLYIKNNNKPDDILILPNYYFEPCIGQRCSIEAETYIAHKHELSWLSENQKIIFDFFSQLNLIYLTLFIITIIIILIYVMKKN